MKMVTVVNQFQAAAVGDKQVINLRACVQHEQLVRNQSRIAVFLRIVAARSSS